MDGKLFLLHQNENQTDSNLHTKTCNGAFLIDGKDWKYPNVHDRVKWDFCTDSKLEQKYCTGNLGSVYFLPWDRDLAILT